MRNPQPDVSGWGYSISHSARYYLGDLGGITVAAAVARAVVATLGGVLPELLVNVHTVDQHGRRGPSGSAGLEGRAGDVRGSVVDHAARDLLTEVCVLARVHEERVPTDVNLGRRRQCAIGDHGRDLEEPERLLHDPFGPVALGGLILVAEELLELQILGDTSDETIPELRADERLVGRRSDHGRRGS